MYKIKTLYKNLLALVIKFKNFLKRPRLTIREKILKERVVPWLKANGDRTLRLNYDLLNKDSLVFDIGGYVGDWSKNIFSKYACNIFIFEPVKSFSQDISTRFKNNNAIRVFNFGLGNRNKSSYISLNGDASSTLKDGRNKEKIEIKNISEFITDNNISTIDLMKINIEGGEYDLLESLIDNNLIKNIKNIQVQFHDFFPGDKERMENIQTALKETHSITYQYLFVWENWKLK